MKPLHKKICHGICGLFLAALFIFLSVRAADRYRWSDWNFADAQITLSLDQWNREGWLNNYLLFIAQGHSSITRLLDEPALRHHAHGISTSTSPRVGPRLWYTHYPPGYLIPYALMYKAGITGIAGSRMLSITLSVAALALMYAVFARITHPGIALVSVVFYGLSKPFLGYADAVCNQPTDDFLRFLFMLLVVLSTRAVPEKGRRGFLVLAWVTEFSLSLCSFDSVFFLYAWLIGWDLVEARAFRWRKYLVFSLAPVIAHGLQFLQNIWYLGFRDALTDITDTFMSKSTQSGLGQKLNITGDALQSVLSGMHPSLLLLTAVGVLYICGSMFIKPVDGENNDRTIPILLLLFLCGLAFVVVLPQAAFMPYQGRQMAPFVSLLAGCALWSLAANVCRPSGPAGFRALYMTAGTVIAAAFIYVYALVDRSPAYPVVSGPHDEFLKDKPVNSRLYHLQLAGDIAFAEQLGRLETRYSPVYFDLGGFSSYFNLSVSKDSPYPQIHPVIEYYAGRRPVLCFRSAELLVRDLVYLAGRGIPFSPVITAGDPAEFERFSVLARSAGLLVKQPERLFIAYRTVADLTGSLEHNWQGKR